MSFLSSFFLYALPAAAVPVIVHLLAKRRKKTIAWGAMQFLARANPRAKRSWRLKDLLLLLLRILVLAGFILALARPLVPAGWLGGHHTRDLILVIDDSLSTQWDFGGETAYERQLLLVEDALDEIAPTDFIRCLVAAESPQWLTSYPLKGDESAKAGLQDQLRKREAGSGSAQILVGLEEAWAAEAAHPNAERHVVLVTDGQAHGWAMEQSGRWLAIAQLMESFPAGSLMRTLRVPRASEETRDNLAVTSVAPNREVVALGEPVELTATIRNFGAATVPSSILRWQLAGEEALGLATVPALEAGASTTVKLEHSLSQLGVHELSAVLESGDGLSADDRASTIVEVAAGIPVLVVEDRATRGDSASRYLQAALGSFTEEDSGVFRGRQCSATELEELRLSDYRVVILTDLAGLTMETVAALREFVQRGGGLWLAPHSETPAPQFNRLFIDAEGGKPLAPAALATAVGDPNQRRVFEVVSPPTQLHPATALLADTERLDLDELRVYRRFSYQLPLPRGLSVLLRGGSGHPLVVEKSLGRGRVILQAFPLDRSWSNLPILQVYVAAVYEWLWYLAEPGLPRFNLTPGQAYELGLPERPLADQVTLQIPRGAPLPMAILGDADGRNWIRTTETLVPGDYRMLVSSNGKEISRHPFQVARDARESDLTTLDDEKMEYLRTRTWMRFDEESAPATTQSEDAVERRQEPLWFWLLMGVLLFLVGESALAWSIAKSRTLTKPGARLSRA